MTTPAHIHYTTQARIAELEAEVARLKKALLVARTRILTDRRSLYDCHWNPKSGQVDDELGLNGLREYDEAIAYIDAAIAASKEKP